QRSILLAREQVQEVSERQHVEVHRGNERQLLRVVRGRRIQPPEELAALDLLPLLLDEVHDPLHVNSSVSSVVCRTAHAPLSCACSIPTSPLVRAPAACGSGSRTGSRSGSVVSSSGAVVMPSTCAGTVKPNRLPSPNVLSTQMCPPCSSTS